MTANLFGNRIAPACKYCGHITKYMQKEDACICTKKGIVKGDYKCRAFVYDPLRRSPRKQQGLREIKEEEFAL
ncbi:MAG: hypothetical protein FWH02_05845 [Oscillospiraceae bacterium]|nr:hypothetical protein [Oscillospiraceae bacterium]